MIPSKKKKRKKKLVGGCPYNCVKIMASNFAAALLAYVSLNDLFPGLYNKKTAQCINSATN